VTPLNDLKGASLSIQIDQPNRQLHLILEKSGDYWRMGAPISDLADASYSNELLTSLESVKIGSILSVDPSSYPDYDLTQQKAVHIQVLSSSGPILDAYFGKPSASPNSLYFRYAAQKEVYLSQGVDNYVLTRSTDDYRERQLFPPSLGDITHWTLTWKAKNYRLTRSSGNWSSDLTGVNPADASSLASSLSSLRLAIIPPPGSVTEIQAGLNKAPLTVTALGTRGQQTWIFGKAQAPTAKGAKSYYRFVMSKERNLMATVSTYDFDPILKILNPSPKK
jgi:hypothetical protein